MIKLRLLPKGTKRFLSGFVAAFVATSLPLSASIAPLRSELVSPIADVSILPNQISSVARFEINTLQVSGELDLKKFAELETQFAVQLFQTEKYIPLNLKDGAEGEVVVRKILQTSVEAWINDSDMKNTSLGRSIASIEGGLSTDIISETENGQVTHSLKFRIQPLSGVTQFVYHGSVEALVGFDIDGGDTQVKVFKNINGTEYSIQRTRDSLETKDMLNLAWSF